MYKFKTCLSVWLTVSCLLIFIASVKAEPIIEDKDNKISFSVEEVVEAVKYLPKAQVLAAIEDEEELVGIVDQMIVNKNISNALLAITSDDDAEAYWKYQFAIRNYHRKLYFDYFRSNIKLPNMEKLAKELYDVNKDKYAAVPEKRLSSHILIKCLPGVCERKEKRKLAEEVLSKLDSGESFESLVEKYSGDPSSKERAGQLPWYTRDEKLVNGYFLKGVWDIKNVGDFSGLVETKFGFHIIRLDEIQEEVFKEFKEVKAGIISSIEKEYTDLSLKRKLKEFSLSDDTEILFDSMKKIFKDSVKN